MFSRKKASDNYLIDINDYNIVQNINKGGFGTIDLVINKKSGEKYAAKTNLIQAQSQNKLFISREVRILIQIQHPTIIRFRGFSYIDFKGDKNITILMDYMEEGSLANLIEKEMKSLCPSNYDNTKRQIILVGIARGMMILHKRCVIHRDLKPENILLDSDFKPCITDFGLSKFFDPSHSMSQSMSDSGTVCYMAPEVIDSDHFNTKADVYAFGILMYEVLSGRRAYDELLHGRKKLNQFQLKLKVKEGLRPKIDFPIKKGLKKMIEKCWSANPKERPSFEEIFKKLSLSSEDYFLEFEANNEEPKILDDDEEEEDKIDEDIESGLVSSKKYCLEDVNTYELLDYIDEIKEEDEKSQNMKNNNKDLEELKEEIKKIKQENADKSTLISSLQTELDKLKKEKDVKVSSLQTELDKLKKEKDVKVSSLQTELDKLKKEKDVKVFSLQDELRKLKKEKDNEVFSLQTEIKRIKREKEEEIAACKKSVKNIISTEITLDEPGILSLLSLQRKSKFDRQFIFSQSSNDIYTLLVPNDNDFFQTDSGSFDLGHILFEFETPIKINGVKIFAAHCFFPKSFDILLEDKIVASVKEANQLNGKYKSMLINFSPVLASKVQFKITGNSWDGNDNLFIKGFEFYSTEQKYSKGVFATLIDACENRDPHRCPVIISTPNFTHTKFFYLNSHIVNRNKFSITHQYKGSWFQVELTKGAAILKGFRLTRLNHSKLRNYKVIVTDDSRKPVSEWTTMIDIKEKTTNEHDILDVYEFSRPSPLIRFIRIASTGPTWANTDDAGFYHFDIFGCYI